MDFQLIGVGGGHALQLFFDDVGNRIDQFFHG